MHITPLETVCRPSGPRLDWHVAPDGKYWTLRKESEKFAWGTYLTKAEALGAGITHARCEGVSLIEHGRDGRFQRVTSYDAWRGPCELCD